MSEIRDALIAGDGQGDSDQKGVKKIKKSKKATAGGSNDN